MVESKTIEFGANSSFISLKTYGFFKNVRTATSVAISNLSKDDAEPEGLIEYILTTGKDFIYKTEPIPLKIGITDSYRREADDILVRDILVSAPVGARVTFIISSPDSWR